MAEFVIEKDAELDALVAKLVEEHQVPGVAVGVVHGDRLISSVHGVTDVENPLPIDEDTLYFIGSTTKTMTAIAIVRLVEEGKLAMTDRVIDHLPDFRVVDDEATQQVTIANLLNHTAGWRGDVSPPEDINDSALASYVTSLADEIQNMPVGTLASYNNSGFSVAGLIIEKVTGQSYEAAIRTLVLEPLRMDDTFFLPWEVALRKMAVGHLVEGETKNPIRSWSAGRAINPAGGAISTVRDQLTYLRYLLHGESAGTAPITEAARMLMHVPTVEMRSSATGVGICLLLGKRGDVTTVGHGGNINNLYLSTFEFFPEHGLGVTVLSNSRAGRAVGEAVNDWCIEHYLGKPARPHLEVLSSAEDELTDFVGRYDVGAWFYVIGVRDGVLTLDWEMPEGTPEEVRKLFTIPTLELVKVGTDQFAGKVAPTAPLADFGRGADGRVEWVRHGLRIARRVPRAD